MFNIAITGRFGSAALIVGGLLILIAGLFAAQSAQAQDSFFDITFTSDDFSDGGPLPDALTCDGANVSPQLTWEPGPDGTMSYALLVEDPDAPGGTFVHWMAANLPPATNGIPQNWAGVAGLYEGHNDFGINSYDGPCPPNGDPPHTYQFQVFALDNVPTLATGFSRSEFDAATDGHILGKGKLTGTFRGTIETPTPVPTETSTETPTAEPTVDTTATAIPTATTVPPTATTVAEATAAAPATGSGGLRDGGGSSGWPVMLLAIASAFVVAGGATLAVSRAKS